MIDATKYFQCNYSVVSCINNTVENRATDINYNEFYISQNISIIIIKYHLRSILYKMMNFDGLSSFKYRACKKKKLFYI